MIETTWNIFKWNTIEFVADGTIPAPSKTFKTPVFSTKTVSLLVDGDECLEGPETKSLKKEMALGWRFVNGAFVSKLCQYVENSSILKLQMKDPAESYDGKFFGDTFEVQGIFLKVIPEPVTGLEGNTQLYHVEAIFKEFSVT